MIISKDQLPNASPKTKRTVRYEYELEHETLECLFDTLSAPVPRNEKTKLFKKALEARVYNDHRFGLLPAYRRVAIDAYIRGALDFAARQIGQSVSQPPDAVTPKTKRPSARAGRPSMTPQAPAIPPAPRVPAEAVEAPPKRPSGVQPINLPPWAMGHSVPSLWGDPNSLTPPAPRGFVWEGSTGT